MQRELEISRENDQVAPMKSAYELAMERLEESAPSEAPLTDEKKAELAETDRVYDAKIAEREVFLKGALAKETDFAERDKIEKQIRNERDQLNSERESKKEKIRQA